MEIITFESNAYKELDKKITAIANYVFNHAGQLRGLHVFENKRKNLATPAGIRNYRLFQHQGTLLLQSKRDTPDAGRTSD